MGARVIFDGEPREPGDLALSRAPALVRAGTIDAPEQLDDWIVEQLPFLTASGVLIPLRRGVWHLAVAEPEKWFAALAVAAKVRNVQVESA